MKVSEVMSEWMDVVSQEHGRRVGDEEFGKLLVEGLVNINPFGRVTILQWRRGTHEPATDMLLDLYAYYYGQPDWRFYWACDMLKAKRPEIFEDGLIALPTTKLASA